MSRMNLPIDKRVIDGKIQIHFLKYNKSLEKHKLRPGNSYTGAKPEFYDSRRSRMYACIHT